MARHQSIDAYIASLPAPLAAIAARTRAVIDAHLAGATSAIRWAHPTWSIGSEPVCYLKAASQHVTFGFWRGAAIVDPSGRLESSGQVMAHVKLRQLEVIEEDCFAGWLRQAHALAVARTARSDVGARGG